MKYLLDVNALIALGFAHHQFRHRVINWVAAKNFTALLTCSITELGFVRILAQAPQYTYSVAEARDLLSQIKRSPRFPFKFIADDQDVSLLPAWVKTPKQTTDGHLVQLAHANGATLATFDEKIPDAFIIP